MEDYKKVVEENINLVWSVINTTFRGGAYITRICGCTISDIFQEGAIGLIKAAKNFDEKKDLQFSTYACSLIKGHILDMYTRRDSPIVFSRKAKSIANDIRKLLKENDNLTKKDITKEFIVEKYKVSEYISDQILGYLDFKIISLDKEAKKEDNSTFGDLILYTYNFADVVLRRQEFKERMNILDSYSRKMIMLQLSGRSQTEVSKILGTNQPQVSRLTKKAVKLIQKEYDGILVD